MDYYGKWIFYCASRTRTTFEKYWSGKAPKSLSSSCAGVTGCRGGCRHVYRSHPGVTLSPPGMFWLPFPPAQDKGRQAGWQLSCSGWVQSVITLLHPLDPDPSPLPCPQGHSHGSSSRTPWSPHLAGGYHGFSCPAPAGHSGLLLILQDSSQMSVFRDWGPWVLDQIGWELPSGGPGATPWGMLTEAGRLQEWD